MHAAPRIRRVCAMRPDVRSVIDRFAKQCGIYVWGLKCVISAMPILQCFQTWVQIDPTHLVQRSPAPSLAALRAPCPRWPLPLALVEHDGLRIGDTEVIAGVRVRSRPRGADAWCRQRRAARTPSLRSDSPTLVGSCCIPGLDLALRSIATREPDLDGRLARRLQANRRICQYLLMTVGYLCESARVPKEFKSKVASEITHLTTHPLSGEAEKGADSPPAAAPPSAIKP
jgi:hypothetical protein